MPSTDHRSRQTPAEARLDPLLLCLLSRLIGEAGGERRFTRSVCVAVSGISRAACERGEVTGLEPLPAFGWPDGRSVLERLGLEPQGLDHAWLRALDRDESEPTLSPGLVQAFFPDELWPWLQAITKLGAARAHALLVRFCRREALRQAPLTRARPDPGTISQVTIDTLLAGGSRLFRALSEAHLRGYPDERLRGWERLPPRVAASDLGARMSEVDRSAPSLALVREALGELERQIARERPGSAARARALRDRALLGLLVCTGARIGALSKLAVGDLEWAHVFPDGASGPALRLRPGKTLDPAHERWKGLPQEVAGFLQAYLACRPAAPSEALFPARGRAGERAMSPSSVTKILTGEAPRPGRTARAPLLPRPGRPRYGYCAHTLRHLAERLAFVAGRSLLERDPDPTSALTPQAYADALLDHAMRDDPLGYKDHAREATRELLARDAAQGIWRLVRGEEPSPLELRRELASLRRRRRALLASDTSGLGVSERLSLLLEHARLSAEIDDLAQRRRA